ncbi:MAG: hypothetical protein INH41_11005 [Myxococcaceae bacterium]|jgi:hypothetical protein|nr:hypothetical protein [Myxococcaceae bacterium]MCA3012915.1 hypothetical protein [Myxococcaceae bacterium]
MLPLAATLLVTSVIAAPWDITPPPRGRWVKDETGTVSSSTLRALDATAAGLDAAGAG